MMDQWPGVAKGHLAYINGGFSDSTAGLARWTCSHHDIGSRRYYYGEFQEVELIDHTRDLPASRAAIGCADSIILTNYTIAIAAFCVRKAKTESKGDKYRSEKTRKR